MNLDKLLVPPNQAIQLKDHSPSLMKPYHFKAEAEEKLKTDILALADLQSKLHAQNTFALLIILQGIDAAGKDGTIKHVMSGVNPAGCQVKSFKAPSVEELDHDYLWRHIRALPERGNIGIFNRSYYEEVLVVRVHPELLAKERIQVSKKQDQLWSDRYRQINDFERYLVENEVIVLKFFLHLSRDEQKKRFLERLNTESKNWKFSEADVQERGFWDDYTVAYEEMLSHTSTEHAPWHVIPADHKWFSRMAVAHFIIRTLSSLDLRYPKLDSTQKKALENAKKFLEREE